MAVLLDHAGDRARVEKGDIAREDHDDAVEVRRQRLEADLERAARSGNIILIGELRVRRQVLDGRDNTVPVVADHGDGVSRAKLGGRVQHVPDERDPSESVEHLRGTRTHPRPLASRQDDDCEFSIGHRSSSLWAP